MRNNINNNRPSDNFVYFLNKLRQSANKNTGNNPFKGNGGGIFGGLGLAALFVGGYCLSKCIFNVEGGHRGLKYSRLSGIKDQIYLEGTHFMMPWFERVIDYDIRAKPRNIASLTGTKDLQMVNITCRVLSRPNINKLQDLFRSLGKDYDERVLPSIVNEVLKSVVAQFNVSRLVRENLTQRANKFHIVLDDVSITHVAFSKEFTQAVEAKQIAQQEAQRAFFIVEKAKQEKQSVIVRAVGEAKSAELIGQAIKNKPGFIELRKIETAREIASILSKCQNRVLLNSDALLLNVATNATIQQ